MERADIMRGTIIRARRELMGWSVRRLARETGLSHATLLAIEAGGNCRVASLRAIADALDIPRADRAALVGWV